MNRTELIDAQTEAASAMQAGIRLAERTARMRRGQPDPGNLDGQSLGMLLADPGAFWAVAAGLEAQGDGAAVEALALETRLIAAKAALGDLEFVRAGLIGQAQWLSVLTVRLAAEAENRKTEDRIGMLKLALAAQRQAAQTLASAAALNRL